MVKVKLSPYTFRKLRFTIIHQITFRNHIQLSGKMNYNQRQWKAFLQPLLLEKSNKYYIFWVCVCSLRYPVCNVHAPHCHLWPSRLHNIFRLRIDFPGKKVTDNKTCFSIFSVTFVWDISLILRRIEPHMITTVHIRSPPYTHDHHCTHMITTVQTWSQLYTYDHNCTHMTTTVHTWSQLYTHDHNCTHMITTVHTWSQLYTHDHNCTHMTTTVHTWSQLYTHDHNCKHISLHVNNSLFLSDCNETWIFSTQFR